ncbi:nucleotide-diphospho-sugar transferase-domain-containing protein [Pilobolus umbonatus]|nr:nucleotide-diphospho-sugar transferase-domain-containing protein [Pilobolus umbonatus]
MSIKDTQKGVWFICAIVILSLVTYLCMLPVPDVQAITEPTNITYDNTNYSTQQCEGTLDIIRDKLGSIIGHSEHSGYVPDSMDQPPKTLMNKINHNMVANRVLIVATANYGMRNHLYNWIKSLESVGENRFMIFCLDDKLYQHLSLAGYGDRTSSIPESWFKQAIDPEFEEYFTAKYIAITHAKTLVVQRLLYMNVNVLFSDVDIVWLRPRMVEYLHSFLEIREETNLVIQTEGVDQSVVNSGFYLMRPSYDMKKLLADTILLQDKNDRYTQQGAMNEAMKSLDMDARTTSVVLLDMLHFPNGFVYFTHNLTRSLGIDPFIVHANYLVGENKKSKLVESKLWFLDDHWLDNLDNQFNILQNKTTMV